MSSTESGFSETLDPLLHQPFGQVRMIGWALAADADVLAGLVACLDGVGQELLDGRITLVEQVRNDSRVTIQAKGQLGHVVRADGEAVEILEELVGQQCVGRQFAHHDHAQAVFAALEAVLSEQIDDLRSLTEGAHEGTISSTLVRPITSRTFFIARHSSSKQSRKESLM